MSHITTKVFFFFLILIYYESTHNKTKTSTLVLLLVLGHADDRPRRTKEPQRVCCCGSPSTSCNRVCSIHLMSLSRQWSVQHDWSVFQNEMVNEPSWDKLYTSPYDFLKQKFSIFSLSLPSMTRQNHRGLVLTIGLDDPVLVLVLPLSHPLSSPVVNQADWFYPYWAVVEDT